jgi:hypothetical protein
MDAADIILFEKEFDHDHEGAYYTIPFHVDPNAESIRIKYDYQRFGFDQDFGDHSEATLEPEINIIDLGLIAPDGEQIGASGSNKTEIYVSEAMATPGYTPCIIQPGEWEILVGAYKIHPDGVKVFYEVTVAYKERRLLKGDLHTHTFASDGIHSVEELAWKAKRHDLDFIAITDHNQMISRVALPQVEGITLIPGIEWTHYQGHANFLGVDKPFDSCFATNTLEETQNIFKTAHERGALITVNHPYEGGCEFKYDLQSLPFDCLEIWNGPMRESNLKAVGLWQALLSSGKKIPACAGSDYHRDTPFIFLGGPTTCVFADSNGVSDILAALKAGHAYFIFAPDGPELEMKINEDIILGDSVKWSEHDWFEFELTNLLAGDKIRVISGHDSQVVWDAPTNGSFKMTYTMEKPGFARVEVLRAFLPGLPLLPALISNPIYFDPE